MTYIEARNAGKLDEFARDFVIEDPHPDGIERFWKVLAAMTGTKADREASRPDGSADCTDTQTPSHTSKGDDRKRGHESRG